MVEQFGPWDQTLQNGFFDESWVRDGNQVILYDDIICGYFCVDTNEDNYFVYELVISPEFQGKGIGSLLLRNLQNKASANNMFIDLEVLYKNTRAKQLYERLGFIVTGSNKTHHQMRWTKK